MKKIFKLAAVAVSLALVAGLAACSSGDDVVDATTPKYLLTNQIDSYVASISYDQNVPQAKRDLLKVANSVTMKTIGDCEACLAAYFNMVKGIAEGDDLTSTQVDAIITLLGSLNTEKKFHKEFVYKPAIKTAIEDVKKAAEKVSAISDIVNGKLNGDQSASVKAYTDAVTALKNALELGDKTKCKASIDAVDYAIATFAKVTNVNNDALTSLTAKTDEMCSAVATQVGVQIDE